MTDYKFYRSMDGDVLAKVYDPGSGQTVSSELEMLIPQTDAPGAPKHLPQCEQEGDVVNVTVGSVAHPQSDEHHIAFIALVTSRGIQIADVSEQPKARASFVLDGALPLTVYAFCNLHGLWRAEV